VRYSSARTALLYAVLTGLYILAPSVPDLLTAGVSGIRRCACPAVATMFFPFFLSRELQAHWHAERV
jgi:hypothetical protein